MPARLDPLYSPSAIAALKNDAAAADYETRAVQRNPEYYAPILDDAKAQLGRALDVGCGSGRLTCLIARHAKFVVGLDLSPTLLLLAHERQLAQAQGNLAWVVGDVQHLPGETASFDFISSCNALRLTDLSVSLKEIERLLKPGGELVILDLVKARANGLHGFLGYMHEQMHHFLAVWEMCGAPTAGKYARSTFSPSALALMSHERHWSEKMINTAYRQAFPKCKIVNNGRRIKVYWRKPYAL